jgi:hypothetical protein
MDRADAEKRLQAMGANLLDMYRQQADTAHLGGTNGCYRVEQLQFAGVFLEALAGVVADRVPTEGTPPPDAMCNRIVIGEHEVQAITALLLQQHMRFDVEPWPDNMYRVAVRAGEIGRLDALATSLGLDGEAYLDLDEISTAVDVGFEEAV